MNSKLLFTALVLATTGLLDWAFLQPVNGCKLKLLSKPETSYFPFLDNHRYELTCVFRSFCRPILSFEYNPSIDNSIYRPIHSSYYRVGKGLSFQTKVSVSGTSYTATMIIDPFKSQYAGMYRCNIASAKDQSDTAKGTFRVGVVELSPLPVYPQCFLPKVRTINVSLSSDPMGIQMKWQLTENEDPEIDYCINSRRWRVRVLSFSSVQTSPADKDAVKDISVQWTNVSNFATEYFFPRSVSLHLYYSFQVVHRGDFNFRQVHEFNIKPITFASYVYYFGEQVPANIHKPPSSIVRLPYGSTSTVHCDARGLPAPNVKWIKESSSNSVPTVRLNNSAILELNHVTEDDAGIYYCLAFNTLVNPPKGRRNEADTWQIRVIIEEKTTGLSCRSLPMDSSVCKSYIHTDLQRIFTNQTINETSIEIEKEDQAIQLIANINYHIPLGTCRDLAHSMMCHNVYPYCDVVPGVPTPRKLCNKVCQEFLTGKCQGHIPKISSLYKMVVEGCDSRQYTGGQSPECIPLSYQAYRNDQVEPIEDTGDCVRGDGRGYSGNIYRTQSGALCQPWAQQKPHPHPMLPEMYRSDLDQAHFSCRNPGGVGSRPWCYTNDPTVRWEYCTIPQCDSCELYNGDMCTHLAVYSNITVTVRRSRFLQSQDVIEEKMYLFFKSVLFLQPTEGCKDILRVLLCQGAFPQCTETATKRLCFDYCQFNQTLREHCPNVFEELSEFVAVNRHFMNTPDCTVEDGDQCMVVARFGTPLIQGSINSMTRECSDVYKGSYNGTVHVTQDKLKCQAWNVQTPHSHPFTPDKYPELENANNYCRNPGNLQEMPWCYTTDSTRVWDYCNIRPCEVLNDNTPSLPTTFIPPSNTSVPAEKTVAPVIFSVIAGTFVGIFILLFCCAIVACYCVSFRHRKGRAETQLCKMTQDSMKDDMVYVTNKDYPEIAPSKMLSIPENFRLLDSKSIKYVSQLGQGNFGIVFKGKAFDIKKGGEDGEEEGIDVAVKMLKEEATSEVKQDFIDEAKLMFTFDHPNILKIHGVCMSEMPYQLVFEYMDEGDLTKFLRSRASSQQRRLINPFSYRSRTESSYSDDPALLTKTELLYICKQIAAGMNYLSENNHVHRDLACRNCLIKSDLVVKIGDFGMSKNLYSKDYYRINGKAVLPVRWMSPESLIYGKFSIEGDVWSFGVVMWEVFSFALQPYYGITNEQVIEVVRKGRTLSRPDNCPAEIYKIMKECWEMEPADRLAFSELYNLLYNHHHLYSVSSISPDKELRECISADSSDVSSNAFYSEEHLEEDCV